MQVLYIYSIKKTSIFLYVFHLRLSLLGCTLTDYHFLIYTTVCHYWCNFLKDFFLKYGHQCQDQFGIFVKISWLESRKENRTCLASRFSVFQYIFYKTHINPQNSPLPNSATGYYATKLQSGQNATLRSYVSSLSTCITLKFISDNAQERIYSIFRCLWFTSKKTGCLRISCWCSISV
jgi:hypothetical protein